MGLAHAAHVAVLLLAQADADDVLAGDREVVLDGEAPAGPQRQIEAHRAVLVHPPVDRIGVGDRPQRRVADDELADAPGRGQIAIDEGRRDREHLGDVVEPVMLVVGRQQRLGVDLEAKQIPDGVRVLHAVEPMDGRAPRVGGGEGGAVELALEPRDEPVRGAGIGPGAARRRHLPGPQAPDNMLPTGGVGAHPGEIHHVEGEPRGAGPLVVAGHAVPIEQRPAVRGGRLAGRGRELRQRHDVAPGEMRARRRLCLQLQLTRRNQSCYPEADECPTHHFLSSLSQRPVEKSRRIPALACRRPPCPGLPAVGGEALPGAADSSRIGSAGALNRPPRPPAGPPALAPGCRPRSGCPGRPPRR